MLWFFEKRKEMLMFFVTSTLKIVGFLCQQMFKVHRRYHVDDDYLHTRTKIITLSLSLWHSIKHSHSCTHFAIFTISMLPTLACLSSGIRGWESRQN